jgi:hypothetical protein
MKIYLSSWKYTLLKILPLLDSSQNATIVEDSAVELCFRVIDISKLSITRQAIKYYVVGRNEKLA